jgi:hypothetical protein
MSNGAPAAAPPKPRGNSLLWLGGVGCGVLVTVAGPMALLLGVLLGPVALARILDPRSGRQAMRPMLLCGLAATLYPLFGFWRDGHSMDVAIGLVTDVRVVAAAWAAEAAGWLMAELLPIVVLLVIETNARGRGAALRAARARHEAEWEIAPTT